MADLAPVIWALPSGGGSARDRYRSAPVPQKQPWLSPSLFLRRLACQPEDASPWARSEARVEEGWQSIRAGMLPVSKSPPKC